MSISGRHHYRFVYLQSEHWQNLRLERIAKQRGRCAVCQEYLGLSLDVHHLQYRNLTDVSVYDLMGLCRKCHDITHEVLKISPKIKRIKNPRLAWRLIIVFSRRWRRMARKLGEHFATPAMVLRQPYLEMLKRRRANIRKFKNSKPTPENCRADALASRK